MNHYYSKNNNNLASKEHNIQFKIKDKTFHFITDNGVFSKSGLDFGSRLLIESAIEIESENVLDLGCGYGPIGIVYKYYHITSNVTMTDVNLRAIELADKNTKVHNLNISITESDGFEQINQLFDLIITNPPVRTGKQKIYQLFQDSHRSLRASGTLVFVMNKKQGAMSAMDFCRGIFENVEIISKKSGFCVIQCIK